MCGEKWEHAEGLRGIVVYNIDLFDETTISRLLGHFKTLLEAIIIAPEVRISELILLSSNEQDQLVVEWNNVVADYPVDSGVHQLFEQQVEHSKVDHYPLKICDSFHKPPEKNLIAPRTSTESLLAIIWAELLNFERVGIHDNFFELGGDSLLAVRLMSRIQENLERELPLSILFLNPTIESLANTLDEQKDSLPLSPLVAIQPLGYKPPFFCVHPIFSTVFSYYELADSLDSERPFYGLQPVGVDGQHPPLTCIKEIVAYYIKVLRTVQP